MLKINGSAFYNALAWCNRMEVLSETYADNADLKKDFESVIISDSGGESTRQSLLTEARAMKTQLVAIGAALAEMSMDRFIDRLEDKSCTYKMVGEFAFSINSRLADELSLVHLFYLDQEHAKYLDNPQPLFGQEVADNFPSANYDIEEAGKCLALRRYTACVTHLMRALEPALQSLGSELALKFERANWNVILDQIEKEIRARAANPSFPNWKTEQQFYSEAAAHFRLLKDAWRNHAMHLHDRYDEERADVVFRNVKSFMRFLATRLAEATPI